MKIARTTVAAATLLMGVACATPSVSTYATPRRSSSVVQPAGMLTLREFSQTSASDLFEAIRMLRPALLHPRGGDVSVAVDGLLLGDASVLRGIPVASVASVRLLHGPDATLQFGPRHAGSVLLVTTRRR